MSSRRNWRMEVQQMSMTHRKHARGRTALSRLDWIYLRALTCWMSSAVPR